MESEHVFIWQIRPRTRVFFPAWYWSSHTRMGERVVRYVCWWEKKNNSPSTSGLWNNWCRYKNVFKNVNRCTCKLFVVKLVRVMVFIATSNNISMISWRSVLLVEETGVPEENHRPVVSHWQTLSHYVVSSTPLHERGSNSQF